MVSFMSEVNASFLRRELGTKYFEITTDGDNIVNIVHKADNATWKINDKGEVHRQGFRAYMYDGTFVNLTTIEKMSYKIRKYVKTTMKKEN